MDELTQRGLVRPDRLLGPRSGPRGPGGLFRGGGGRGIDGSRGRDGRLRLALDGLALGGLGGGRLGGGLAGRGLAGGGLGLRVRRGGAGGLPRLGRLLRPRRTARALPRLTGPRDGARRRRLRGRRRLGRGCALTGGRHYTLHAAEPELVRLELVQAPFQILDLRGEVRLFLAIGFEIGGEPLCVQVVDGRGDRLIGHVRLTFLIPHGGAVGCYPAASPSLPESRTVAPRHRRENMDRSAPAPRDGGGAGAGTVAPAHP
ncbi:hypothetical protein E6R62_10110 [Streptomyces sp. A1136]|nr:hypothetical protein E6R62_10110 [Streptomyces sp. A1136]